MKISIVGAGNVGATTAMRLVHEGFGDIAIYDIARGLAYGKKLDMDDASAFLNFPYQVTASDDINVIAGSDIVIMTAGLARKPGMSREELLSRNAAIIKEIGYSLKKLCPAAIVIVVTNPLDIMTRFLLEVTGFSPSRVIGMGISLDSARFVNLISKELAVAASQVEALVISSHGQGMLPLTRLAKVKGVALKELLDQQTLLSLVEKTVGRGAEIVSYLGSGSAYFAPSLAVSELVRAIVLDEKRIIGVSAYLSGAYGLNDVCIGVPAVIGKSGIEKIVEIDLDPGEKNALLDSAQSLRSMAAALITSGL